MIKPPASLHRTGTVRARKSVLIVEDSRTMRLWLRRTLEKEPRLEVIGEAADASQAEKLVESLRPDVITLDIGMPGIDGLEFLGNLMRERPTPVVMISGRTTPNSAASIKALYLGAIDCLQKPGSGGPHLSERDIARRVFAAACCTVSSAASAASRGEDGGLQGHLGKDEVGLPLVLIGASTGGVTALEKVLMDLDPQGPPVVVVQHMPGAFLVGFASHLDRRCPQDVALVREGVALRRGQVRIAPAMGQHTGVRSVRGRWFCQFDHGVAGELHCPSVDHLFQSAVGQARDVIGVILTGLGKDGAASLAALRAGGAITFGQDRESCAVYGMPRAARELGALSQQRPLDRIASAINAAAQRRRVLG